MKYGNKTIESYHDLSFSCLTEDTQTTVGKIFEESLPLLRAPSENTIDSALKSIKNWLPEKHANLLDTLNKSDVVTIANLYIVSTIISSEEEKSVLIQEATE